MSLEKNVVEAIEKATGQTVQQLRATTIDDRRKLVETAKRKPMRFYAAFPFIGRGSVMGDKVVSHVDVEKATSHALR